MMKFDLLKSVTLGVLGTALLASALPAEAQERRQRPAWSQNADRAEQRAERRAARAERRGALPQGQAAQPAPAPRYAAAPRDRSYGATTRAERREDARESRRDFRQGYRAGQVADGRSDREAYRTGYRQGQREEWRDDRREQRQAYARGYRAGDRSDDGRWSGSYGRWDNRAWRNDRRYDWYRYRAANRALFSPGRYYAPYRGYGYNRLSIGFMLGSPFYANRYWIADPWRYRLPRAYGPYRWVRYYDDALLVDTYSGRVVDVVHDFFW